MPSRLLLPLHLSPSSPIPSLLFLLLCLCPFFGLIRGQYYNAPMMTGSGCVATGNKLYSHGNFIRELNGKEMMEMEKYKRELVEWKQRVDEAYARLEQAAAHPPPRNNSTTDANPPLPVIPPRPALPSFCTSNQTTLYILAGCTVQNNKVYIAGKFARELTDKERGQLEEFARQMLAQQAQQMPAGGEPASNGTTTFNEAIPASPSTTTTTTVSPTMNDIGRQIALDFCMEF